MDVPSSVSDFPPFLRSRETGKENEKSRDPGIFPGIFYVVKCGHLPTFYRIFSLKSVLNLKGENNQEVKTTLGYSLS